MTCRMAVAFALPCASATNVIARTPRIETQAEAGEVITHRVLRGVAERLFGRNDGEGRVCGAQ